MSLRFLIASGMVDEAAVLFLETSDCLEAIGFSELMRLAWVRLAVCLDAFCDALVRAIGRL